MPAIVSVFLCLGVIVVKREKKAGVRQKYKVVVPFPCPNHGGWHQEGEELDLLPCESEFLVLSGKLRLVVPAKKKGEG